MPKPTLAELHAQFGTQPAPYIDDYCAERQGYPVRCPARGKLTILDHKPTKRDPAPARCGECAPQPPLKGQR
jgi:hypothetical protein